MTKGRGRSTGDKWLPGYGQRIRDAKKYLGYDNNVAFAAFLGVTPAAVSQWESETTKPSPPVLERLLQCGISQRFIIRNEGEMYTRQITDEDEYRRVLKMRHLTEQQRKFLEQMMDTMRQGGEEDDDQEGDARPPN